MGFGEHRAVKRNKGEEEEEEERKKEDVEKNKV